MTSLMKGAMELDVLKSTSKYFILILLYAQFLQTYLKLFLKLQRGYKEDDFKRKKFLLKQFPKFYLSGTFLFNLPHVVAFATWTPLYFPKDALALNLSLDKCQLLET